VRLWTRFTIWLTDWLDHVAPLDPSWADPGPSQLDELGRTYPSYAQILAAVQRSSTTPEGKRLLFPWDEARVTQEVCRVIDQAQAHGEVGDVAALRRGRRAA
jgi:hypothetical protein